MVQKRKQGRERESETDGRNQKVARGNGVGDCETHGHLCRRRAERVSRAHKMADSSVSRSGSGSGHRSGKHKSGSRVLKLQPKSVIRLEGERSCRAVTWEMAIAAREKGEGQARHTTFGRLHC